MNLKHRELHERTGLAQLIAESLVWDNHVCVTQTVGTAHMDGLLRAHQAGFNHVSVNIGDSVTPLEAVVRLAADFRSWVHDHADRFIMAENVDDVRRASHDGRTAVSFDLEGAWSLDGQVNLVPLLYRLGVRWMLIAYNTGNWAGGGCHDDPDDGLTAAGVQLVEAMDAAGMVKCCSHTGYRTARDVLDRSEAPVVFSHSNALALRDHPRNIPDDLIVACAQSGGVVGVNGLSIFLGEGDDLAALVVRHIDYMVQLVGPQHVGLGLDYTIDVEGLNAAFETTKGTWPEGFGYQPGIGFLQPERLPDICEGLLRLGYGDADLRAILGGNFYRVAETVWRPAGEVTESG